MTLLNLMKAVERVKNNVGKGEIVCNMQFLLSTQTCNVNMFKV